nr:helix-turn-helix domain-containing protein [Streptomyces agglomeratus]
MFADGRGSTEIAKVLRVSVRSVQRWRRAWQEAGPDGVRSRGPASRPKLSDALFAVLEEELAKGPVAHGWPDLRWTLARIPDRAAVPQVHDAEAERKIPVSPGRRERRTAEPDGFSVGGGD